MSLKNILSSLSIHVQRKTMLANQKFNEKAGNLSFSNLGQVIAIFTIILPISTLLYWRLLFEEFNADYFERCFDINDIYYILYYKATTLMYIILLLLAAVVAMITSLREWKFATLVSIILLLGTVVIIFLDSAHFAWYQSLLYSIATIALFIFFLFRGTKALYGYIILSCLFLVTSAKTDALHYKQALVRKDILLKDGSFFLRQNDKTRYYITSTSKYVLVYEISTNQLLKVERESVKY